jgi:Uma2 family endonuclease
MSVPKSETFHTIAEYLALERESEERHEYLDGLIYTMAAESLEHSDICMNLSRIVGTKLLGSPCRALSRDTKVRSGPIKESHYSTKGQCSYPDLVVVCGEPQFYDEFRDVLINPQLIIEVLSPDTEAFDRGVKFVRYRTYLDSLSDYLVVAQTRPLIEHFTRRPNSQWLIATATDLSESVRLTSIDCVLRLGEVYDRIAFATPPDKEPISPNS